MINKPIGNYTGSVVITQGTKSKTVIVELQVINDETQFYITPEKFSISLQKNLAETKTLIAQLSNPNNLNIQVIAKPSFIDSISILGSTITIVTVNSDNLQLGNYSGSIIFEAGAVQRTIKIDLSVTQAIQHDFTGQRYYFALDPNKVNIQKTAPRASYVSRKTENIPNSILNVQE